MNTADRNKIINARDKGFQNAIRGMKPEDRDKATKQYAVATANRERNYTAIVTAATQK